MAGPHGSAVSANVKFVLGDRMQNTSVDVLEALLEAAYTRCRDAHLFCTNLGIEKLRFFSRLALNLRCLDARR